MESESDSDENVIHLPIPGCPTPLRALTFDELGLIKVIEADQEGDPDVVATWGEGEQHSSKGVVAACMENTIFRRLAVARKDGTVDLLNPDNGKSYFSYAPISDDAGREGDIVGLHVMANHSSTSSSCNILTCTTKGWVSRLSSNEDELPEKLGEWNVNRQGHTHCCEMDASGKYLLFGGAPDAMCVWDIQREEEIWEGAPPKDKCAIETWFTCATFMEDNQDTIVAGNNAHEISIYDTRSRLKVPDRTMTFWGDDRLDYWVPITAIAKDLSGSRIYVGNDSGDIASVDSSTGRVIDVFNKLTRWPSMICETTNIAPIQTNPIKFIARHAQHPVIASSGLDGYLRIWNVDTGKLLTTVYPMQHLTKVIFDSN